jgi:hypothetical protein
VSNQKVESIPTWDRGSSCGQSEGGKYSYLEIEVPPVANQKVESIPTLGSRFFLCPIRRWKVFLPGIEVRPVSNLKVESIPTWDRGPACVQSEGGEYSYLGSRILLWPIRKWKVFLPGIEVWPLDNQKVESYYLGLRSGL